MISLSFYPRHLRICRRPRGQDIGVSSHGGCKVGPLLAFHRFFDDRRHLVDDHLGRSFGGGKASPLVKDQIHPDSFIVGTFGQRLIRFSLLTARTLTSPAFTWLSISADAWLDASILPPSGQLLPGRFQRDMITGVPIFAAIATGTM